EQAATATTAAVAALVAQAGAEPDPAAADAAAQAATAEVRAATQLADTIAAVTGRIATLDATVAELTARIGNADTVIATKQAEAAEAQRQAAEHRAAVVAEVGDGIDPAWAHEALRSLADALGALSENGEAVTRATTAHQTTANLLTADLAASAFPDLEAVEAALRDDAARAALRTRIDSFDRSDAENAGVLAEPDLADLPDERPDTDGARQATTAADAARVVAVERLTETRLAHTEITRLAAEHRDGVVALGDRSAHAAMLTTIAERCAGKTAPKVSLQRWVLGAYLDDICTFANQRLLQMTSGRYQLLTRSDEEHGAKKAGLGLDVLDAYTGDRRDVSTLSGGETFQASLALALGVADAVQAHSGGIRLEALFIDEGFGTLDPDSLEAAMEELDRLRAGGRTVGIISHVGALKERIRTGIQVTKGNRGSKVTVGVNAEG
ncbi:MAG: SbcC/MukB-like Walker B domain-containing protein, partial [Actinomycetes bacterium]